MVPYINLLMTAHCKIKRYAITDLTQSSQQGIIKFACTYFTLNAFRLRLKFSNFIILFRTVSLFERILFPIFERLDLIESKKVNTQQHKPTATSTASTRILIETNNYPLLKRYLSNKKCSWILKNLNAIQSEQKTSNKSDDRDKTETDASLPFIQLDFERFSTQLSNDYL